MRLVSRSTGALGAATEPFARRGRAGSRRLVTEIFAGGGITVGGAEPWDLRVHDDRFYDRVLAEGTLGLGESYMDGWWDCDALDELVHRALRFELDRYTGSLRDVALALRAKLTNLQAVHRAGIVAEAHYDLGNDFFEAMLGPSMVYSCAYWRTARDLDAAQEAKLDLVCRKLAIEHGDRVLDVGCGWGSFARYAAERYGCTVTGVTISAAQRDYAVERCKGLPVDIHLLDYRADALKRLGPFDKIASMGMFEHVGKKNYALFGRIVRSLLAPGGLFLLQSIGRRLSTDEIDAFFDKHIFPNGVLPSPRDVVRAMEPTFVLEDWQSASADYEKTLLAWHANLERFASSPGFRLGRRFERMWRYYLLSLAGAFRARNRHQLWQIVFSPEGVRDGYVSVR